MKKSELAERIEKLEMRAETNRLEYHSLLRRHHQLIERVGKLEVRKSFEEPALQHRPDNSNAPCACAKSIMTAGPGMAQKIAADIPNLTWTDNKAPHELGTLIRKPCGTGWSVSLAGVHIGCWAVNDPALGANWRTEDGLERFARMVAEELEGKLSPMPTTQHNEKDPDLFRRRVEGVEGLMEAAFGGQPSVMVTATQGLATAEYDSAEKLDNEFLSEAEAMGRRQMLYQNGLTLGLHPTVAIERARMGAKAWDAKERAEFDASLDASGVFDKNLADDVAGVHEATNSDDDFDKALAAANQKLKGELAGIVPGEQRIMTSGEFKAR